MAAKSSGNSSRKKTGAKNKTKLSKSARASARSTRPARGRGPVYMLVILGLLTVLVLMLNKFAERTVPASKKDRDTSSAPEDLKKHAGPGGSENTQMTDVVHEKESNNAPGGRALKETNARENTKIYLIKLDERTEKMYLSSVPRRVGTKSILESTMRELIKGPTPLEKKRGYLTAVPRDLRLNGIRLKNRTVELDFSSAIERDATGSILLNRIDQIVYTATQFPGVTGVIIKINGKKRETLGADGLSIGGPLQRRE
jgi:germination protein M